MSAIISDCGLYRYELKRSGLLGIGSVLFVMSNPSDADAEDDDPTVRKCRGFTERWGRRGFTVVNKFAFRATDARELLTAVDPVGPDNRIHIEAQIDVHDLVVFAWGRSGARVDSRGIEGMLSTWFPDAMCLGFNQDSSPRHPLMQAYKTKLVRFDGAGGGDV